MVLPSAKKGLATDYADLHGLICPQLLQITQNKFLFATSAQLAGTFFVFGHTCPSGQAGITQISQVGLPAEIADYAEEIFIYGICAIRRNDFCLWQKKGLTTDYADFTDWFACNILLIRQKRFYLRHLRN
jgi:hypothetical protein